MESGGQQQQNENPEENVLDDLLLHHQHEDFDDEMKMKKDDDEDDDDDELEEKQSNGNGNVSSSSRVQDTQPISGQSDISDDESQSNKSSDDETDKKEDSGRSDISEDEDNLDGNGDSRKSDSEDEKEQNLQQEKSQPLKSRISKIEAPDRSDNDETEDKKDSAVKKKGKSYDYATKLNYLFRDARFFLVKSNNAENVALAKAKGVWSTPPANESRFNQAFADARNVILVYSIKESGRFAGVARLATAARRDGPQVSWVLPPGLNARQLGGVFKIEWISRKDLSFQNVQHLFNPWNEGKPIKIGRDGQEIEPHVAEELCRLFPVDHSVDMTPILRKSKESARLQRAKPMEERRLAIPTSRPLSSNRGAPPSSHYASRGRGGGRDLKRRADPYDRPPSDTKYMRTPSYHRASRQQDRQSDFRYERARPSMGGRSHHGGGRISYGRDHHSSRDMHHHLPPAPSSRSYYESVGAYTTSSSHLGGGGGSQRSSRPRYGGDRSYDRDRSRYRDFR